MYIQLMGNMSYIFKINLWSVFFPPSITPLSLSFCFSSSTFYLYFLLDWSHVNVNSQEYKCHSMYL